MFKSKATTPVVPVGSLQDEAWWTPIGGSSMYAEYKNGDYENAYGSITKIVQGFASVQPYAMDDAGELIKQHVVIDNLYNPNKQMSAYDFREALALMFLIHDEVYLRVHTKGNRTGGRINFQRIDGFTFLENVSPVIIEGRRTFNLSTGEQITDDEVLCLMSANPYNLAEGYSASRASRRWTRLDDYIADYQTGFFRNGAVPAGQFIITAPTLTEYQDIVRAMKAKHQGAGKNNNVTYSFRPLDAAGKAQNEQIQWVPFNTQNKDLALKDLLEAVNEKVDSSYGVPAEIRGHLENSNYASVAVAEKIFVNYTLRPFTFKIWNKFSHELTRVTGGFEAAISFDLETPVIADEEKAKAETKQIEVNIVSTLVEKGYELKNVVEALQLDPLYEKLGKPVPPKDNPEVATPEKTEELPAQQATGDLAKKVKKPKQLTLSERDRFEHELSTVIRNQLNKQVTPVINSVDDALLKSKAIGDVPVDEAAEFGYEMRGVLEPLVNIHGTTAQAEGMAMLLQAGLPMWDIPPFRLTEVQRTAYVRYLTRVATGFNEQTAEAIRNVLANGISQGLTVSEIKGNLSLLIDDHYRINRLAVSEVNRAQNHAGLYSMENIQEATGHNIRKVWKTTGVDPCEFCLAMENTEVPVHETFLAEGDSLVGKEGGVYINNFVDADTADLHSHCHCIQVYEVRNG